MNDAARVLNALRVFGTAAGDDASKYINFDEIAKNRDLLNYIKSSIEGQISREFLPGFQFKCLKQFAWHFKHEYYWRWFLLGCNISPTKYNNHWIRRFLLPTSYHYRSEIAHAIQSHTRMRNRNARHLELPRPTTSWTNTMRDWLTIKDLDRGFSRRSDNTELWDLKISDTTPSTLMKWARKSKSYRTERQTGTPPNYWAIVNILYQGGQLRNVEAINQSAGMVDTGYLEIWRWLGEKTSPSPRRHSLSFVIPVAPDSWNPPDRHFRL